MFFAQYDVVACLLLMVLLPLAVPPDLADHRVAAAVACLLPAAQLTFATFGARW